MYAATTARYSDLLIGTLNKPAVQVLDFDLINSLYSIKLYKKFKNHSENYYILKIFLYCKNFKIGSKLPF